MQVQDLVHFSKERCFNGAVQTEWFYDENRVRDVADSYVFHGPKYFGVSDSDVDLAGHRLVDTASFALNLAEKLHSKKPSNSFVMTIAGYGAGKSHLAVGLAALFSGDPNLADIVTSNIQKADKAIAEKIRQINDKKNFVIVLNGMNNFNLDAEVLRCTRLSLEQNGMDDAVLRELTKSYDIAKQFVERTFDICQEQFEALAPQYGVKVKGLRLKQYIIDNIESSNDVITLVNSIYKDMTGDSIRWDRGLAAGDILGEIYHKLCGEGKPFNKILVLFDEFGRYIEYAAANSTIAGEASLQQIFEAVQSANGGIIFAGFVQNELDAYLARIEKTSNIMRYVGRYKTSENLFLSSNFETILANLLQKVDEDEYDRVVNLSFRKYERFHSSIEHSIQRWDRSTVKKSVWTSDYLYKNVIMRGCYPIHPITVWLLSNMNNWMQQRSAITFVAEMVDKISAADINGTWLPYVYPINIIDSSIYNEMLNSEEKGLVQSQYCMLYRDIQVKIGDKLNENELKTLKAVLVVNIGRFSFSSKDAAVTALRYCSNLKEDELVEALKNLENLHGVVAYDETANTFDLIAEANGFNEFKRVYGRYRTFAKSAVIEDCDDAIRKDLGLLTNIETSFAQQHHISSREWCFKRTLIDSSAISEATLIAKLRELDNDYSGDGCRGEIIFAYCSNKSSTEITRLAVLHKKLNISKSPLIIIFLDDSEGEIISALTIKNVLNRFSNADNERFKKHVTAQHKAQDKKIIKKFNSLVQDRCYISDDGLTQYQGRLNALCSAKFDEVYSHALPFMFDGFENKTQTAARRYLANICIKMFDKTLTNIQSYNALSTDEKNRIKSCLTVGSATSWQVYNTSCTFAKPVNAQALEIFDLVEEALANGESQGIMKIFAKFARAPYGMNINSIVLFFFYYIAVKDKHVLCYFGDEKLQPAHVSDKVFKGGKLQRKELVKIRIQKNAHVDVDLIRELCDEIMSCTLVEQCQSYKKQLNDLLIQEGITPENQLIVASASARLDEGIGLRNTIYDQLQKGQELIVEAKKSFGIQKFVRVFSYYANTTARISETLPFVYSDSYKTQMDALKKDADALIKKYGKNSINRFSCKITQLSQYKAISKTMAANLRNHGYEEYAKLLEQRTKDVEEDLLAKQKYEASLVDLDKDIFMIGDVSGLGHTSCTSLLEKMKGWERFFCNISDMPEKLLDVQKEKIKKVILELTNRISDISVSFHNMVSSINQMASISEITLAEERLNTMITLGLNEDDTILANECLRKIAESLTSLETLPDNIDELGRLIRETNISEYGCCSVLVSTAMKTKLSKLQSNQTSWVEKYISPVLNNPDEMNAVDCSNWLNQTNSIPLYLSTVVLEKYKQAKIIVEQQLHKSRVQGVLVMYNKLTEEERKEFKRIIQL